MQGLLALVPGIKGNLIILKMQIFKEMYQMNKIIHTKVQITDTQSFVWYNGGNLGQKEGLN